MASQYKQRFLPGEKELADKLRPLVEPLRKQYDTKEEQAVCLQELGELYLKAGEEAKNGKDFTKAAALFHAALVRTSKEEVQKEIKGHIMAVRQEFMKVFYPDAKLILQEQWEEIRMRNIQTLEKIRTNVKENSHSLKLIMDRYDIDDKDVLEMETCLVKEAKKVTLLVQEEMLEFIKLLWNQSMEFSNGIQPCKYSMMGLGSLARQEVTPYSDLEFAILVGEKGVAVQRYFEKLSNLFHLSVLDLGETPIPAMAIPSLNDFMTPGGDWFFDKITPSGFKFDAEMPWACKTPSGRQATPNKRALSFIKTPVEMAELLKNDSVLGQSYHVADVLSRTIHITGDFELYDIYQQEVVNISHESGTNRLTDKRKTAMFNEFVKVSMTELPYRNVKVCHYRLPSTFVENMRQWLTPSFPGGSQWCIIENFTKKEKLSEEHACQLKVVIALAYGVRLFTYFTNKGQREKMESDQFIRHPGIKSIHTTISILFITSLIPILLISLGDYTDPRVQGTEFNSVAYYMSQTVEHMGFSRSPDHPPILMDYCSHYIGMAVKDQVLPRNFCRDTCQRNQIDRLDADIPNIADIDLLLKNTHLCSCVSMVQVYLKMLRYYIQRFLKLHTGPPEVYLNSILDELSTCRAVRDCIVLNFNLLKLASFITDVTVLKSVTECCERFFNNVVPKLTKGTVHKIVFQDMEFEFYRWLLPIYAFLGENEKMTTVLERWINVLETYNLGGDFEIEPIGTYISLGKVLMLNPEKEEEGIRFHKRVLQRLNNKVNSNSSSAINNSYYEETLAESVVTFAGILYAKNRYQESEALLKEYFFNENKSFTFTKGYVIVALKTLAYCYMYTKRWTECTEICNKIYHMVISDGFSDHLSVDDRSGMGSLLVRMHSIRGNIKDLHKAAEFHKLICNTQKDKVLAVLEHKIFLLTSSFDLFTFGFKSILIQYVKQALTLDDLTIPLKKVDFSKTDIWLLILAVLCNALDSVNVFGDIDIVFENYDFLDSRLRNTHFDLYQIYVEFRLCHCLFSIAMDPDKSFVLKLNETTDYLYQTQTRLTIFFPKCATAIKWCKDARLHLNPFAKDISLQDSLKPLSLYWKVRGSTYRKRFGLI